MCSELAPRARIPDTRIPQLMQPWFWSQDYFHTWQLRRALLCCRDPPSRQTWNESKWNLIKRNIIGIIWEGISPVRPPVPSSALPRALWDKRNVDILLSQELQPVWRDPLSRPSCRSSDLRSSFEATCAESGSACAVHSMETYFGEIITLVKPLTHRRHNQRT